MNEEKIERSESAENDKEYVVEVAKGALDYFEKAGDAKCSLIIAVGTDSDSNYHLNAVCDNDMAAGTAVWLIEQLLKSDEERGIQDLKERIDAMFAERGRGEKAKDGAV